MGPDVMHVVSGALVRRDGRILFGLRREDRLRPLVWEMPGGKVEAGETPQQALFREWQEELHVDVDVGEFVTVATFHVERAIVISLYEVSVSIPNWEPPRDGDHVEYKWADPLFAVTRMPCSPGVFYHFDALRGWMQRRGTWMGRAG